MSATLAIKVVPGASRTRIAGWLGDVLKITVVAPAESGKANAAVVAMVALALGVPGSDVRIVRGATSPRKLLEIEGLADVDVLARLAKVVPL